MKDRIIICDWDELTEREPHGVVVDGIDVVVVRYDDQVSVLEGRCPHRGALLADGHIDGPNIVCGVHNWDFRFDTGVSEYNNEEVLHLFPSEVINGQVTVAAQDLAEYKTQHPPAVDRDTYQGAFQATHQDPAEPHVDLIRELASHGLDRLGHHGPMAAMGVSREQLPQWDDILFATAQLAQLPQLDHVPVDSTVTIGPAAGKPLKLDIPLFVSDMSFGALSEEAKIALAKGAELAGTGICSGEGGMLPEEQAENSRYFFELASGRFGYGQKKLPNVRRFILSVVKVPRLAPVDISPVTKSPNVSLRCAEFRWGQMRFLRHVFLTGNIWKILNSSLMESASLPMVFLLVSK